MPKVYNWQLGREMSYPYDAGHAAWQFAFVFNPNRCIGCQTCTMACKSTWTFSKGQEYMWWNNVETKPYGGYPHHWDVKTLDLLEKANPGGQNWGGVAKDLTAPYGKFNGKTVFEAAKTFIGPEGANRALGYLPTDDEWSAVAAQFTAMAFDEHVGDAGTVRTDWIEDRLHRARVPGRSLRTTGGPGPSRQPRRR